MKRTSTALATALLTILAAPAFAQSQGDFTFGIGAGYLTPKDGNGTLAGGEADIGVSTRPIFTVEYFLRDNLGIELLAATPFEHDISIDGIGEAGSVQHLPPTLSLNYHFPTNSAFTPYVGAGLNYTTFFNEESDLGDLKVDDSWGVALQAGVDYAISDRGALRFNVRWFDIQSDVTLDGASIGEAEIDPWLIGVAYVFQF
jgi:outer membrane protein